MSHSISVLVGLFPLHLWCTCWPISLAFMENMSEFSECVFFYLKLIFKNLLTKYEIFHE